MRHKTEGMSIPGGKTAVTTFSGILVVHKIVEGKTSHDFSWDVKVTTVYNKGGKKMGIHDITINNCHRLLFSVLLLRVIVSDYVCSEVEASVEGIAQQQAHGRPTKHSRNSLLIASPSHRETLVRLWVRAASAAAVSPCCAVFVGALLCILSLSALMRYTSYIDPLLLLLL